jgi:spiro-SPASM protein
VKILVVSNFCFANDVIISDAKAVTPFFNLHLSYLQQLPDLFSKIKSELPEKIRNHFFGDQPFILNHAALIKNNQKAVLSEWTNAIKDLDGTGEAKMISISSSEEIIPRLIKEEFDALLYLFSDEIFLCEDLNKRLIFSFFRYIADFSFSDGLPLGFTSEIINKTGLIALEKLMPKAFEDLNQNSERWRLFDILQQDVNAFDVETILAKADFRIERLLGNMENPVNFEIAQKLLAIKNQQPNSWTEDTIIGLLRKHAELKRSKFSFVQLQITNKASQEVSYLPLENLSHDSLNGSDFMELADIKKILDQVSSINPQATISLSPWGELSLHPQVFDILNAVLAYNQFSLVLETSGTHWDWENFSNWFSGLKLEKTKRINIIVLLDSIIPEEYHQIRGDGFENAMSFISNLQQLEYCQFYVQRTRLKDYEDTMLDFYRYWKSKNIKSIIQKYEDFAKQLPARKLVDLTPVNRNICWKIRRELFIYVDGTVGLCKTDLKKEMTLGNALNESLEDIWSRGEKWFTLHKKEEYPELCKNCDEYYIYNF